MNARSFALVIGVLFLIAGALGFIPGPHLHPPVDAPDLRVHTQYGYLFGLFPVNVLHNFVHVLIGVLGIVAAGQLGTAIAYSRGLAVFYGILVVMGLVPALNTFFGLIPIFGHDVWLHGGTAAAAAYFGWVAHGMGRPVRPAHRPV